MTAAAIYNRWGKEIYSVNSTSGESNFTFWNGFTKDEKEASTGVYFYKADILFDVRDPSGQKKQIKGWVQVVR
jgi:hypothetical protein